MTLNLKTGFNNLFNHLFNHQGLTLIEVLIALAIFVTSFMALIDSQNMNVRISAKSKRMTQATLLAEEKMAEMLLKFQGKSLSEIPEKEEGKFDAPYEHYSWEQSSRDFNYDLSFLVEMTQGEEQQSDEEPQSPLMAYLPKISQFINKSSKEITVTILWKEGSTQRKISITTHLFDYKAQVSL